MSNDCDTLRARVEQAQALAVAATPGPWRSEGDTMTGGMDFRYVMIPLPVGTSVASGIIARCPRFGAHAHEAAANADLMAAAPDLAALVTDLWAEVERARAGRDAAAAKERASVVAWLRERAKDRYTQSDVATYAGGNADAAYAKATEADAAADAIEAFKHLEVTRG